jgi:hypothetical protein
MTKQELLEILKKLEGISPDQDVERPHIEADEALIEYINDPEIAEAYEKIPKWYI